MGINPDFNYESLLSFEKAKLSTRGRQNSLGSLELIFTYQLQTDAMSEDAVEWLDANRQEITDPTFSNKTYEGTWKCISIEYGQNATTIVQRFKIDSSLLEDVSRRSKDGTVWKDYHWRIVDPRDYNIPEWTTTGTSTPDLSGLLWYDSHTEINGEAVHYTADETYALWYDGSNYRISIKADVGGTPTDYFLSAALEGVYAANGAWTGAPEVGFDSKFEWSKTANDNGDGTFDVIISKSNRINLEASSSSRVGGETSDGTATDSIVVYQAADPLANGEYTFTSGDGPPDYIDGTPSATDTRLWTNLNSYTIDFTTHTNWAISDNLAAEIYFKNGLNLNSFGWRDGGTATATAFIIVQVGVNLPLFSETIKTDTSSTEASFVSDGGSEVDPTIGQEKTISNTPLPDGTFQVTITTRTMNYQRIPALEDSIIFGGDSDVANENIDFRDKNAFIWARNATYEQYQFDINYMTNNKNGLSNIMSASINKWGLYDYTIRSVEI